MDLIISRLLLVVFILAIGFALAKIVSKIILKIISIRQKVDIKGSEHYFSIKTSNFIILTATVIICLLILKVDVIADLVDYYAIMPELLTIALIIILVVIVITFIENLVKFIFESTGVMEYLIERDQTTIINIILFVIKAFLYILALFIVFNFYGINSIAITYFFEGIGLAILFIFAGLSIFAFKDVAADFGAGIALSISKKFKLGKVVKIDDEEGEIREISKSGLYIVNSKEEIIRVPNSKVLKSMVYFEKVKSDISTLESIQEHFVWQKPSYCGPACAAMALSMFGYDFTQDEIGKKSSAKVGVGTHPVVLGDVVSKLTKNNVITVWIDYDKINNVKEEIRGWLSDEAIVMIDYKKNTVFPQAKKAHYSLAVGVQGNDLLLIDPSQITGGVYYVDHNLIRKGMNTYSELIQGKRGYLVYAKKGTTAYDRIKNGMIYSDKKLYKHLTEKFEKELDRALAKGRVFENIMPKRIKGFIKEWKEKPKKPRLVRVWKS